MATVRITRDGKEKIERLASERAKSLAIEARDELTKRYLFLIKVFYYEYEPTYYVRHFNNNYSEDSLVKSGLGHTFNKYYHNSRNYKYSGGIQISTANMFTDYKGRPEDVLRSFLNWYHGPERMSIKFTTDNIYSTMLDFKKDIIENLKSKAKIVIK